MSEFRLSPEAEAELDDIWIHIARDSHSRHRQHHRALLVIGSASVYGAQPR
jgi:plasmid stabilization system protein ParE